MLLYFTLLAPFSQTLKCITLTSRSLVFLVCRASGSLLVFYLSSGWFLANGSLTVVKLRQTVIVFIFQADVYSFGLVVLEMSIGELPVPQEHSRQLGKVVEEFLRRLIRECIQPNPDERADMQRVVAELKQRKAEIAAMN